MRIQKFVEEALEAAMAAPPPTTRKAAYRIQKFVLVEWQTDCTAGQIDNSAYYVLLSFFAIASQ
jgi:hypothetical protein